MSRLLALLFAALLYATPVQAQLFLNELNGFGVGATSSNVTISFTDSALDADDLTTYTFSGRALGTAAANRKIIVGILNEDQNNLSTTPTSVTVAGVAASLVVFTTQSGAVPSGAHIYQADVPAGTTGDIEIVWSDSRLGNTIGLWAVYGASASAHDTDTSTASPPSVTLTIPAGGVAVGVVYTAGGTATYTWTNLTENFDATHEGTGTASGASAAFASGQNATITVTPSSATTFAAAFASWGP